ncbi:MAG: metalloregulator ArsR/SmtB family transcription factor [bacterium]|nr:metalloregulator ArsR/SmtB family transcription factor [Candidatus Sumerlaeota bacterium]
MDNVTLARYEARAQIAKALAHSTRLFIIDELSRRDICVCDLTEMIGADISTVSKHLTILKSAGLVQGRKHGAQIFYRLRCPCVLGFFGCMESVLKSVAEGNACCVA